jgi:ketosteroid isomerase-like protein
MSADANRALVRRYLEMWSTGDESVADAVLAPDYFDHAHPEARGPEGVKQALRRVRAAFPDMECRPGQLLCEGEWVAFENTIARTQDGRRLIMRGMGFARIVEGRLAEQRTCYEPLRPA